MGLWVSSWRTLKCGGESVWGGGGDSESVDVWQRGNTVLCTQDVVLLFTSTVRVRFLKWQLKKVCFACSCTSFTKFAWVADLQCLLNRREGFRLLTLQGTGSNGHYYRNFKMCIPNKKDSKILQNRRIVMYTRYSIKKICTEPKFYICNLLLDVNIYVLLDFPMNITQHILRYKQYCIWQILSIFIIVNRMQWSIKRPRYVYEKKFSFVCGKSWFLINVICIYNNIIV